MFREHELNVTWGNPFLSEVAETRHRCPAVSTATLCHRLCHSPATQYNTTATPLQHHHQQQLSPTTQHVLQRSDETQVHTANHCNNSWETGQWTHLHNRIGLLINTGAFPVQLSTYWHRSFAVAGRRSGTLQENLRDPDVTIDNFRCSFSSVFVFSVPVQLAH